MKKCIKCQVDKNKLEFAINHSHKDGLSSYCKLCNSANARAAYKNKDSIKIAQKSRAASNRLKIQNIVNQIKSNLGCSKCPETDYRCLDLHHVDASTKKASVSNLVTRKFNLDKIQEEIDKCVVLCSNCHRKHHAFVV